MSKKTKILIKFVLILIASFLSGCLISRLCLNFKPQIDGSLLDIMAYAVPAVAWGCNIVLCIFSWRIFRSKKKIWNENKEDEDVLDRVEYTLNIPILLSNMMLILNLFLFALAIFFTLQCSLDKSISGVLMLAGTAAMVFGMIWTMILQSKLVSLEKTINPEKQGEILDVNFQRDWMNSCDEAQKVMVYRAAYAAFKAVSMVCMVCWAICFLGLFTLDIGVFPVIILVVIHMTLIVTFTVACMRQERPGKGNTAMKG